MIMCMEGYHGTDSENTASIRKNNFSYKKFNESIYKNKMPCDIGNGIYFYVNDKFSNVPSKNAYDYAKLYPKPSAEVTVFKCKIEIEEEKFLDLDEHQNISIINDFYQENIDVIDTMYESIKESGAKKRAYMLGLILEMYFVHNKIEVDAIQKETFTNFKLFKENKTFIDLPNGRELAVKNKTCIKEIEISGGE